MSPSASMSRREFVTQTASAAACAALASSQRFASLAGSGELLNLSAHEAIDLMSRGELSAERYADALLAQAERGKSLNAFISLNSEKVRQAARAADLSRRNGDKPGRLHGLPVPVKDSINTKDYPTTAGTNALRHFTPKEDAPLIRTLTSAGAIVMGKTNLHELSFGWTSNNLAYGAVHNPYDATRIPGGSSGGTAAAVAVTRGFSRTQERRVCGVFGTHHERSVGNQRRWCVPKTPRTLQD